MPLARGGVDIVVARADAAHEPQARQRRKDPLPDRRVLRQNRHATGRCRHDVVLGLALRGKKLHAPGGKELALQLDVGVIVIGVEDAGHVAIGKLALLRRATVRGGRRLRQAAGARGR